MYLIVLGTISGSWSSSVSIVSGYGRKDFSCSLYVQNGSGAHPASYPMDNAGPLPGAKARPRRNSDHSPPPSSEVENEELCLISTEVPSWR
jgi:hypothetical protein